MEDEIERYYDSYPWLTGIEQDRIRGAVRHYGETKLKAAKKEAERARRRIEALKQEQQQLIQLSYKGLVDEEVLAEEQARLKAERAEAAKWSKSAQTDAAEIAVALEEALKLMEDPGTAYRRANAITRRMFNQALFERLEVHYDGRITGVATPWFQALIDVGRPEANRTPQEVPEGSLKAALDRHEVRKHLSPRGSEGSGLNEIQMVRAGGLRLPRTHTRPQERQEDRPV